MYGALFIQKITGTWPVYPGHPLVLATAIMDVFPDFESASKVGDCGFSNALGDQRIPGAGDHVDAAMRMLSMGHKGAGVDEVIAEAARYWTEGRAGGHVKNVNAGVEQAAAIEPHFRVLFARWSSGASSPKDDHYPASFGAGRLPANASSVETHPLPVCCNATNPAWQMSDR